MSVDWAEYEREQDNFQKELSSLVRTKVEETKTVDEALFLAKTFNKECYMGAFEWTSLIIQTASKNRQVISIEQLESMEKADLLSFESNQNPMFKSKKDSVLFIVNLASDDKGYNFQTQIRNLTEMGLKVDEAEIGNFLQDGWANPDFLDSLIYFSSKSEPVSGRPFFSEQCEQALADEEGREEIRKVLLKGSEGQITPLIAALSNIQNSKELLEKYQNPDNKAYYENRIENAYQCLSVLLNNCFDPNVKDRGFSLASRAIVFDDARSLDIILKAGGKIGENERKVIEAFKNESQESCALLEKRELEKSMSRNLQVNSKKMKI